MHKSNEKNVYFLYCTCQGRILTHDGVYFVRPKPANKNVTIILFEKAFCQTSPSFKQDLFVKDKKTVLLGKDHDEARK